MMVDKKLFFFYTLCFLSGVAYTQEINPGYAIDSVKVTLYDYNNSVFFDYHFFPDHILIHGEKTVDSISKPMRLEPYQQYHEHKEFWWKIQNADTMARFVNYAITIVNDPDRNWIEECQGPFLETDKTHLDVYVYQDEKIRQNRIVLEPNCRYVLFIDEYVSFLKRLGWF